MQHVLHLTMVLSPWFGRFFGPLEGSKQCCSPATGQQQTNACVVTLGCLVQDLKNSMILVGSFQLRIVYDCMILSLSSQVFCWVNNISLHGQRKQGPIQHVVAAWFYCLIRIYLIYTYREVSLCCPADPFSFTPSPLSVCESAGMRLPHISLI